MITEGQTMVAVKLFICFVVINSVLKLHQDWLNGRQVIDRTDEADVKLHLCIVVINILLEFEKY